MSLENLSVELASQIPLDVRTFVVEDRMSALFTVDLMVHSPNPALDFDSIVGQPARFRIRFGAGERVFSGVVAHIMQTGTDEVGLSTYELRIVPRLWLATQRRNYRIFQQMTEPDIALVLLREWGVEVDLRLDRAIYKKRKYRLQYAENDHAFVCRMLEDAGVASFFVAAGDETRLVLSANPHDAAPRSAPLVHVERPLPGAAPLEFVTNVRIGQRVRPGRYTMRDRDYRLAPDYPLGASASRGRGVEERLERFHYTPGAFLFGTDKGESTPAADDRGKTRSDEALGEALAQKRLDAKRGNAKSCTFSTNALDLAPGLVLSVEGHPHPMMAEERRLLVVGSRIHGTATGEWSHEVEARATEIPYRPPLVTRKPRVNGMETATVVGPPGEEIHVDELGRVRVQFPWDREGRMNNESSCWVPVSQLWGGAGYGGINLPRVGQEVLVEFLGGDPDRPIIVGRVFTNLQKVPYRLPEHRTRSAWKSNSTGQTGGYNEILFEDLKGRELVYEQAERDRRRLTKHDEVLTVGNDRSKLVKRDETEVTLRDRTEVTRNNRTEITEANRTTHIGQRRTTIVESNDDELIHGNARWTIEGGVDVVVEAERREHVGAEHLDVGGSAVVRIGGSHSVAVGGDRHETIAGEHVVEVKETLSIKAKRLVLEVEEDFCIKGPGGFIRVQPDGIVIKGSRVKINSGGAPISASEAKPEAPLEPARAEVAPPPLPTLDDVSRTGIGQ
ncbi:type VI secretion system Vgr family protein [Polyangium spumosum]|uniref:type VI secretion system Vgr family protein n=1 Tax=Polyangium spumosum TaxID=889282 RepID=UPI00197EA7BD|nr:type VI secretion system tip protein TssI/VgrG [Polyangium spumosum]